MRGELALDKKNPNEDIKNIKKSAEEISKFNGTINSLFKLFKSTPLTDGEDRQKEIDSVSNELDNLFKKETNRIVSGVTNGRDIAGFINAMFARGNGKSANGSMTNFMQGQSVEELLGDENSQINIILSERYKNVNNMYEDLRLLTDQITELDEVISTFRDAITNSDNITAEISRVIQFEGESNESQVENKLGTVETMEEVTGIVDKLKKIIIPGTLTFGNFFVFTQPYVDLFAKFKALDERNNDQRLPNILEQTIAFEHVEPAKNSRKGKQVTPAMESIAPLVEKYSQEFKDAVGPNKYSVNEVVGTINTIMEGITVVNDPMVPLLEDSSISGIADADIRKQLEKTMNSKKTEKSWHTLGHSTNQYSDGTIDSKSVEDSTNDYKKEFKNSVNGVYIKLYDPRRVIPVRIMDYTLGYYVLYETVDETRSNVLNAVHSLSRTTMMFQNSKRREFEEELISLLSARICENIDKKFLQKNAEFRELIANAISYENFYRKSFRIQFVPVNYMTHFKINEDYNTHMGVSVLKRSLFYGMLYLSILLFKIIMIVTRSTDTRMFLIKSNPNDKNITNRISKVVSDYKQNQISYNDFGSVRGILSKVGKGRDMAIPVGASGERSFEVEIMQGQDVPLDTPLLEMLRKAMISNTGCPSAMVNYLEEVDFAKQIQMIHSKFISRIVSIQSELDIPCTELYRKLLSYGDYGLGDTDIENMYFKWSRPKGLNNANIGDLISTSEQMAEFITKVYVGDNSEDDARIKDRIYRHVITNITMQGTIDWESIEKDIEMIRLEFRKEMKELEISKPTSDANDSGGDAGGF